LGRACIGLALTAGPTTWLSGVTGATNVPDPMVAGRVFPYDARAVTHFSLIGASAG
jgi:hypothetical protein